ncbi:MAG: alkaline phosphatase family protein [Kofleriaceae bacterium]
MPTRVVKPAAPRLVVLIVIDQLPVWVFERDRGEFRHGLARLQREAAYAVAELPYANTFTAPGHATIGTGAPPSVHGVLANQWYRRSEGSEQSAEYDPAAPVFAVAAAHGEPLTTNDGASSRQLRVGGIADQLRASHPGARSVSISLKPRAATLMTGKRPDLAVWYEGGAGGMTTSRAYAKQVPPWLVDLARTRPPSRFLGLTWTPLDPAQLARVTGIADDGPGESAVHGLDPTFPHTVSTDPKDNRSLLVTPFADEVVLDAVLAAIPAMGLGADDIPDLLAVSFNAHDYAGHMWGPDSWEVLDLTLRLDMLLGRLFETLDRQFGADGWAAVLTSDHGATPLVERAKAAGARRIRTDEVMKLAEAAVVASHGPGPWVAAVSSNNVYFTAKLGELPADQQLAALDAAGRALSGLAGVAAAGAVGRIAGGCGARVNLPRAICLSIVERESGDLYVLPQAGTLITDYMTGTSHDAPFDDNRRVPVFVRAPGLAVQTGKGSLLQIAPTVTALLGVPPPEAATLPPLFGLR